MKRDLELLRSILLAVESSDKNKISIKSLNLPYNEKTISYHIELLLDVGYLEATEFPVLRQTYSDFIIKRITSFGHDYLDNVRDDNVWNKTKSKLGDSIKSASLDVITAVSSEVIKASLGI